MEYLYVRIRAGMAFLDGRVPDWRKRINFEMLDMGSPIYCVLGQLGDPFGMMYSQYRESLGLSFEQAVALGFDLDFDEPDDAAYNCTDLTEAWETVFNEGKDND